MASQNLSVLDADASRKLKRSADKTASNVRHDSSDSNSEVKTRSGRVSKPSLVMRESTSDSNNETSSPVKRRRKETSRSRAKSRNKFTVRTSSDTASSSQETVSSKTKSPAKPVSGGGAESISDDIADDEMVVLENTGENNSVIDEEDEHVEHVEHRHVKSVVKRVTVTSDKPVQDQDIDKSLKAVMENPSALETVIKNVMPAFVMMSQQYAAGSPGPSAATQNVPVLARGESEVDGNFQQLTIQSGNDEAEHGFDTSQSGGNHGDGAVNAPVDVPNNSENGVAAHGNESEVTVYRRGCTKVGESDNLRHLPIIQDIQNQLNKLNVVMGHPSGGEELNIRNNVSDSDNVTSDESLLLTSSDEFEGISRISAVNNASSNFAGRGNGANRGHQQQMGPGPSAVGGARSIARDHAELEKLKADERAREIVKQAANAKAQLLKPPGESANSLLDPTDSLVIHHNKGQDCPNVPGTSGVYPERPDVADRIRRAFMIDQKHSVLGAHVDDCVREAIQRGDYINLSRLLPKDAVIPDDDLDRYHVVGKDGISYYVKKSDEVNKDLGLPITSLARWDEAFRTYSAIYLEKQPWKATQLAEYVNYIHRQAATFIWSNVYNYDILFRRIMITDPERDWDIIHYQYSMQQFTDRIADRVKSGYQNSTSTPFKRRAHKRDPCWRFNRTGKCKFGNSCTFDHRCASCGATDHGQHECKGKKDKVPPVNSSTRTSATAIKSDSVATNKSSNKH